MLLFLTSITAKVFSTPSLSSTRRPYNQHLVYFPWALDHCEHKGQVKGLILHIIVKGLVTPVYREAIYHPDLSISETPHISLSSPCTHSFAWSPHIQVPKSFEEFFFFISTFHDEHIEIKSQDKGTLERIKRGTRWKNDIVVVRKEIGIFSRKRDMAMVHRNYNNNI